MGAAIARTVVSVMLALLFPPTTGAATPRSTDLDMCSTQKQKNCRRVSLAELDRMRGGMVLMSSIGPIEVTFGISQAVYVNNKLVALTQLVIAPMGNTPKPSLPQLQAASTARQSAPAAPQSSSTPTGTGVSAGSAPGAGTGVTSATPVVTASLSQGAPAQTVGLNGSLAAAPTNAGAPGQATSASTASPTLVAATQTTGLNGTLNAVPSGAGAPAQATSGSSARAAANSSTATPAASVSPTVLVNGSVVTPGNPVISIPGSDGLRRVIVQNGFGNVVVPSAAEIASGVGTIIQNTANNQAIRAVTEMNVSIALSKSMNAASISNAVRQGMITSRP